ncbi:hypothetical protein PIB30_030055 [Stylosanthes scabra]|uniref:Uncharacterized protein n=1 Tax=Stylosanthes scabra TaxID=79078 RepID=A0ABU6UAM2_9FABA|nr:hypothetical protein [Stylosanthes scabra]
MNIPSRCCVQNRPPPRRARSGLRCREVKDWPPPMKNSSHISLEIHYKGRIERGADGLLSYVQVQEQYPGFKILCQLKGNRCRCSQMDTSTFQATGIFKCLPWGPSGSNNSTPNK